MTTVPLTSLQFSFDTVTERLIVRCTEGAVPNHPDPISFSPKMDVQLEFPTSEAVFRDLFTGEFVNPETVIAAQTEPPA